MKTVKTASAALEFVERHGAVLESARGPIPNLAEAIAGETIRGSWWGHPKGHLIYELANAVADSPDIVRCRLVGRKITLVHRRLWPALFRMRKRFDTERLAAIHEEHTATGAHRSVSIEFPKWVPADIVEAAAGIAEADAAEQLRMLIPARGNS